MTTSQSGKTIKEQNDVFAQFHKALGAFQHQIGHLSMTLGSLVEGRSEYFRSRRFFKVGYFFWTLIEQ